ncbi:MAG: GNAT family N-acetyltransferase [Defluviitaleaceae bacterium]|nr:GNAT family N-acetyltransferase [Defluviitaleaceae bacterium]
MLDKSIDYKNVIMKIESDKINDIESPMLPDGFSFRFFRSGDEEHWARIEASVLEFDSADAARAYFERAYLPHKKNLEKRCIFALNRDGLPIATANSWFADSKELGYQASLHWVAVCPDYQGLGIGRAITKQALINFQSLEPNKPVWLHTQTWSHPAIRLYHNLGFSIMKTERLANNNTKDGNPKIYRNDFYEAIEVLRDVMDDKDVNELISTK